MLYCDTMEHTACSERLSVMGMRQTKSGVAILVMDQVKKGKQHPGQLDNKTGG